MVVSLDLAGRAHGQPLDGAPRHRLAARKLGAPRPDDLGEVALFGFQAHLDGGAGGRLVDDEEPLAIVPLDPVVEIAVGVGAVEQAPADVVDAQVQPGIRAGRAEPRARRGDRVVGDLPVDVEPLGIDHHGRDAVVAIAPGDIPGHRRGVVPAADQMRGIAE